MKQTHNDGGDNISQTYYRFLNTIKINDEFGFINVTASPES